MSEINIKNYLIAFNHQLRMIFTKTKYQEAQANKHKVVVEIGSQSINNTKKMKNERTC